MYKVKFCATEPSLKARQAANRNAAMKKHQADTKERHAFIDEHGPVIFKKDPMVIGWIKKMTIKKKMRDLFSLGRRARRRKSGEL